MTNGAAISGRIREALDKRGLKRGELYQYAGISSQSLRNWKLQNSIPGADTAIKMADFLKVSVKWLILGEDDSLSSDEQELVINYRSLEQKDKNEILGIINLKLENAKRGDILLSSANA